MDNPSFEIIPESKPVPKPTPPSEPMPVPKHEIPEPETPEPEPTSSATEPTPEPKKNKPTPKPNSISNFSFEKQPTSTRNQTAASGGGIDDNDDLKRTVLKLLSIKSELIKLILESKEESPEKAKLVNIANKMKSSEFNSTEYKKSFDQLNVLILPSLKDVVNDVRGSNSLIHYFLENEKKLFGIYNSIEKDGQKKVEEYVRYHQLMEKFNEVEKEFKSPEENYTMKSYLNKLINFCSNGELINQIEKTINENNPQNNKIVEKNVNTLSGSMYDPYKDGI